MKYSPRARVHGSWIWKKREENPKSRWFWVTWTSMVRYVKFRACKYSPFFGCTAATEKGFRNVSFRPTSDEFGRFQRSPRERSTTFRTRTLSFFKVFFEQREKKVILIKKVSSKTQHYLFLNKWVTKRIEQSWKSDAIKLMDSLFFVASIPIQYKNHLWKFQFNPTTRSYFNLKWKNKYSSFNVFFYADYRNIRLEIRNIVFIFRGCWPLIEAAAFNSLR